MAKCTMANAGDRSVVNNTNINFTSDKTTAVADAVTNTKDETIETDLRKSVSYES